MLGDGAGNEVGAQEDDNELQPHILQGNEERGVGEGTHGHGGVVDGHDVDHHPGGNGGEEKGLGFGLRHEKILLDK